MKKQFNENSTKRIGEFFTLKEARKALVERECKHGYSFKYNSFNPVPIYQENDGTFSIRKPVVDNAKFVEAVDPQSGRRFYQVKIHGELKYIPKKKIQPFDFYRGYGIIFPE